MVPGFQALNHLSSNNTGTYVALQQASDADPAAFWDLNFKSKN